MLVWSDELATGNEGVDHQHRRLFEFVNRLEQEVMARPEAPLRVEDLEFLKTYAQVHFASEELCMFRSVCAMADQNKTAHRAFLRRVEELESSGEAMRSPADLVAFLNSWIRGHILAVDRGLSQCLDVASEQW